MLQGDHCHIFNFSNGCQLTKLVKRKFTQSDTTATGSQPADASASGSALGLGGGTGTKGGHGTRSRKVRHVPRKVDPHTVLATGDQLRDQAGSRPSERGVAFGSRLPTSAVGVYDFGLPRRAGSSAAFGDGSLLGSAATRERRTRKADAAHANGQSMRDLHGKQVRVQVPDHSASTGDVRWDLPRSSQVRSKGRSLATRGTIGTRGSVRVIGTAGTLGLSTPFSPLRAAGSAAVLGPASSGNMLGGPADAFAPKEMHVRRGRSSEQLPKSSSLVSVAQPTAAQRARRPESDSVSEVTCIAYCVYELPRMRGQTSIQNKYIISVGWDRRAYVWRDYGHFGKEHGYLMRFPDDNSSTQHTDDVLCVAFCPPNVVATGGYDGFLLLWSINSRWFASRAAWCIRLVRG